MELRSLGNNNQDELVVSPVTSKIIMRFRAANASGILLQVNDDDFDGDGGDGGRLLVELYQRTLIVALKLKGINYIIQSPLQQTPWFLSSTGNITELQSRALGEIKGWFDQMSEYWMELKAKLGVLAGTTN